MSTTKDRLLDSAEQLFSSQGFSATSVRQITTAANANLAAMNYHFGSKEQLISAVFARRLAPLNEERLVILEHCCEESEGGIPSLEESVRALVGPALRLSQDPARGGERFMLLMGRAFSEPGHGVGELVLRQFQGLARRFFPLFRHHLEDLTEETFFWRIHFLIGAMAHTMAAPERLRFISGGRCSLQDPEEAVERLVEFVVAGLRAPDGAEATT